MRMHRNTLEGGDRLRREAHRALRPKSTFSKFLASLLAAVLSVAGLVALGPAAYAATPGITTEVWDSNGNVLSDSDEPAVLDHGETLTLRVQYDTNVTPGVPIAVGIPDGLTVDSGSVAVPDGNTAIASIEIVGEEIHFVFNETDDWAPGHTSGVFGLDFTIDEVGHTGLQEVTWVIDGEPTTINLVVRVPGDEPGDVTNELSKSVTSGNLMGNEFVIVDRATDQVAFNGDVTRHDIQYTLLINSDADTPRENFTISDELSEYLVYDGNFTATITTWDESGWNQSSEEFEFSPSIDGKSFSETINVQGPS